MSGCKLLSCPFENIMLHGILRDNHPLDTEWAMEADVWYRAFGYTVPRSMGGFGAACGPGQPRLINEDWVPFSLVVGADTNTMLCRNADHSALTYSPATLARTFPSDNELWSQRALQMAWLAGEIDTYLISRWSQGASVAVLPVYPWRPTNSPWHVLPAWTASETYRRVTYTDAFAGINFNTSHIMCRNFSGTGIASIWLGQTPLIGHKLVYGLNMPASRLTMTRDVIDSDMDPKNVLRESTVALVPDSRS